MTGIKPEIYDSDVEKQWCPGCGNFGILTALKKSLVELGLAPHEVLIDAPPVKREVEFEIDVYFPKEECYRSLGDVSPVVRTLAHKQFDDYVKQVRIFVHPRCAAALAKLSTWSASLWLPSTSTASRASVSKQGPQTRAQPSGISLSARKPRSRPASRR